MYPWGDTSGGIGGGSAGSGTHILDASSGLLGLPGGYNTGNGNLPYQDISAGAYTGCAGASGINTNTIQYASSNGAAGRFILRFQSYT
jgi:hypothetical protein